MSSIGAIIAAGVAPATLQGRQVARGRDKQVHEQQRAAQRTREMFDTHLDTLEENDETNTAARLRADAQMQSSEHQPGQPGFELARVTARTRPPLRRDRDDRSEDASPLPHPPATEATGIASHTYEATGRVASNERADSGEDQPHIDVQG